MNPDLTIGFDGVVNRVANQMQKNVENEFERARREFHFVGGGLKPDALAEFTCRLRAVFDDLRQNARRVV